MPRPLLPRPSFPRFRAFTSAKQAAIVGHDLVMTALALALCLALRFEDAALAERVAHWPWLLPAVAYAGLVYGGFGLYRSKWRFASVPDLLNIARAASVLALSLLVLDYLLVAPDRYGGYFLGRQAIVIYWIVQTALLGGPRLAYRALKDRRQRRQEGVRSAPPAILVGKAAEVEVMLRLMESGASKHRPVGILSPREGDLGQLIRGVPVLGGLGELEDRVASMQEAGRPVRRLVLAPGMLAPEAGPEALLERARRLGLAVSRMQAVEDGAPAGLAPVVIEDLLLRPTVAIDRALVEGFVRGKRVAVTGGGGSIGAEILARLAAFGADAVLVIENSEPALHAVTEALALDRARCTVDGRLCDVRDAARLTALLTAFRPDLVFHAAALKHVPYLERDWAEGVRTNVLGTANAVEAAVAAGARGFVNISTDKAIAPVSWLGGTKRFAEMIAGARDREGARDAEGGDEGGTRLLSVRFGNVLGSNGSVVPKFKAQIEHGGPVTVTDAAMVRYFMTVREAADLVLTAAAHAVGAPRAAADPSVYVLKMGQPVRIIELAERMIRLAGFEPGRDIEVLVTGARPGERLGEILFAPDEPLVETGLDGVMAARARTLTRAEVEALTARLAAAAAAGDEAAAVAALREAVPAFRAPGASPAAGPDAPPAGDDAPAPPRTAARALRVPS